jgi:Cupin-like domain
VSAAPQATDDLVSAVENFPLAVEALERIPAPARDDFERRYVRASRPVVLTGVTQGWLPPPEWTPARMAARYGDARVVAARLADGTLLDDEREGVVFERVLLRDFVASLAQSGTAGHYVMAPTWNFPDTLREDFRFPPYCDGAAHLRAKVWVGKAGTMTPTHRDVPHNLHVHLSGRKRWLLFRPADSPAMYSRGLLSGMPNFAQVDPERPDYDRFPRFRGVTPVGGVVHPGETLFIPHGWWHHTRTLDDAVSMNFWWGGSVVYFAVLASTLFKRVRRIRRDEWG